jgi:phosphatidylglycerophosphate synthase
VPSAVLYLASPDDAAAGRLDVAGRPVAFRVLMTALRAGCPSVAVPAVFRGTEVDRAIQGSPRAKAGAVWLDGRDVHLGTEPAVLLPSTLVLASTMLETLLDAPPVAMLSATPADAPVVLADRAVLCTVEPHLAAGEPAGDAVRGALPQGRTRMVRGGWSVRATTRDARNDAERRLCAELGSAIDTRLDQSLHRPLSRHLTRLAVMLGLSANLMSLASLAMGLLAVWCLAQATVRSAVVGIALYFVAAVLDHVDGEVARLTYADSKVGEWLDVAVDTVVHAATALALGVAAERVAGSGFGLGVAAAIGFALSALAAKTAPRTEPVPRILIRLGNRDGFYVLLLAFLALLALAPAALPGLLLVAAVGSHAYWLGHAARRLRQHGRSAVLDETL